MDKNLAIDFNSEVKLNMDSLQVSADEDDQVSLNEEGKFKLIKWHNIDPPIQPMFSRRISVVSWEQPIFLRAIDPDHIVSCNDPNAAAHYKAGGKVMVPFDSCFISAEKEQEKEQEKDSS